MFAFNLFYLLLVVLSLFQKHVCILMREKKRECAERSRGIWEELREENYSYNISIKILFSVRKKEIRQWKQRQADHNSQK